MDIDTRFTKAESDRISAAPDGELRKGAAVIVARGRKVPKGTVGVVRWLGYGNWGPRVGLAVEGEEKLVYTALSNLELDESPEGLAREVDAAHDSALWWDNRKEESAANKAEAEALLPTVTLKKGDTVVPSEGTYAGRTCRVCWVGANGDGLRCGVVPKGRPAIVYGKPVWPKADWLPIDSVKAA